MQNIGAVPPAKAGEPSGGLDLWDVSTGKVLGSIQRNHATSLTFSPDGKTIAVAYGRARVELWDVAGGTELKTVPGKGLTWPEQAAFSPDGKLLALYNGRTVILWELAAGKEAARFGIPKDSGITSVWCLPDGRVLVLADDNPNHGSVAHAIEIWDVLAGKRLHVIRNKQGYFTSSALSPDGNLLATGCQDTSILLWDLSPMWKAQKAPPRQLEKKELQPKHP
jgi:WD40 repeat protein